MADCPYYARVELLADKLALSLPQFEVRKIVKIPTEWENFLHHLCEQNHWNHYTSPIVWREPVDFGGMKLLIGGSNEFQEYVHGYYGVKSDMTSCAMVSVAADNIRFLKEMQTELEAERLRNQPFKVVITHANSAIGYSLLPSFLDGSIFGRDVEVTVCLYDETEYLQSLQGIAMEAEDTACGPLRSIQVTTDLVEAFTDSNFILMLDELHKNPNESNANWRDKKMQHFVDYGRIINQFAKKDVKVALVVRMNDRFLSCFAAPIILSHAPDALNSRSVGVISAYAANSVQSIVAERLDVNASQVKDTIVWGTHPGNESFRADCSQGKVFDSRHSAVWAPTLVSRSVRDLIHDENWLDLELPKKILERVKLKQESIRHTAALSIAGAIVFVVKHWIKGDGGERIFTLGVASEGWYDIPQGMFFFMPVRFNKPGSWSPVLDLDLSDKTKFAIRRLIATAYEEQDGSKQSFERLTLETEDGQSSLRTLSKDHHTETDTPEANQDFTGLSTNQSSDDIIISPDSFQKLQVYEVETSSDSIQDLTTMDHSPSAEMPPASAESSHDSMEKV